MANCGCPESVTPQPCCVDCPEPNPCDMGCLDIIDATCIEYTSELPSCIDIANGSKLDFVIRAIDDEICALQNSGDKLVRISGVDTASGYLSDKITTCDYLTQEVVVVSGQQKLKLCINTTALVSQDEENPIFLDLDGLNINYTTLVTTIVNNPTLLAMICDACAPI
jgi:hypothetical protein